MINLYTPDMAEQQQREIKRILRLIHIGFLLLIFLSIPFIIYRNPTNHLPSIISLSILWTFGVWWGMTKILEKFLPLKRDIAFSKKIQNSETKEVSGLIIDCEKEITILRMSCYILRYQKKGDEQTIYQAYLDKRFHIPTLQVGTVIRMKIAQHFICAYEIGGSHE